MVFQLGSNVLTKLRMNALSLRSIYGPLPRLSMCCLSTSVPFRQHDVVLDQASRDRIYPKLGNRDIVGYGINGSGSYHDLQVIPMPGVRFKENTPDVLALREKDKGDWRKLTLDEKKALYRISFCQTFAEMLAPKGEWKTIIAGVLAGLTFSGWILIFLKLYVCPPLPSYMSREYQQKMLERMVAEGQGRITGVSSKWDYDKGRWKE